MWQLVFASRHRLIHQQEEEQGAKNVPNGHGRSFGYWPWQKFNGHRFTQKVQFYK